MSPGVSGLCGESVSVSVSVSIPVRTCVCTFCRVPGVCCCPCGPSPPSPCGPFCRTATVWRSLSPFWGEEYTVHLPLDFHHLAFYVLDEDTVGYVRWGPTPGVCGEAGAPERSTRPPTQPLMSAPATPWAGRVGSGSDPHLPAFPQTRRRHRQDLAEQGGDCSGPPRWVRGPGPPVPGRRKRRGRLCPGTQQGPSEAQSPQWKTFSVFVFKQDRNVGVEGWGTPLV